MSIRINKLAPQLFLERIEQDFSIYELSTDQKFIPFDALYLEPSFFSSPALASLYENRSQAWILFPKESAPDLEIYRHFIASQYPDVTVQEVNPAQLPPFRLLQLLLNSLAQAKNKELQFFNLTGKFYYTHPGLYRRKGSSDESWIWQVTAIEFKVDRYGVLHDNLRPFTSLALASQLNHAKTPLQKLPRYCLNHATYSLRRWLSGDEAVPKEDLFVMRQLKGHKKPIPYISFKNWEEFNTSKAGGWYHLLSQVNKKLSSYVQLDFIQWENYRRLPFPEQRSKLKAARIAEFLLQNPILLLDEIKSEESKIKVQELKVFLEQQYCMQVLQKVNAKTPIIWRLIPSKESIEEGEQDPYLEADKWWKKGKTVHHFTWEDFIENAGVLKAKKSGGNALFDTLIKESIIKQDLLKGEISLYDWASDHHTSEWLFGYKCNDNLMVFMKLKPDGKFSFETYDNRDLFSSSAYHSYAKWLNKESWSTEAEPELLVLRPDGAMNVIARSSLKPLPEVMELGQLLQKETKPFSITTDELSQLLTDAIERDPALHALLSEVLEMLYSSEQASWNREDLLQLPLPKKRNTLQVLAHLLDEYKGHLLKSYLRSGDVKYKFFAANLDIVLNPIEGDPEAKAAYFVGQKSKGIQQQFIKASPIRLVLSVNDSPLLFEELLPTLNVDFVRNGELTVLPFPVKYIREWINIQKAKGEMSLS